MKKTISKTKLKYKNFMIIYAFGEKKQLSKEYGTCTMF